MKFLKGRDKFLNKENKIFEKFDMSGEGSGPMGNDINWGDSLVGRLLNSISRKKAGLISRKSHPSSHLLKRSKKRWQHKEKPVDSSESTGFLSRYSSTSS